MHRCLHAGQSGIVLGQSPDLVLGQRRIGPVAVATPSQHNVVALSRKSQAYLNGHHVHTLTTPYFSLGHHGFVVAAFVFPVSFVEGPYQCEHPYPSTHHSCG